MKTSLTSKFESDIKDLKSAHEMTLQNQKDELDAEITKLKEQLASQQREHDTVVTNLTEAHTTALRDKTTEHDAALAAADERLAATRDEHRSRMEKLQIELSETVEKLKAEAVARETEAREKHEKQLLDMQVKHAESKGALDTQVQAAREQEQKTKLWCDEQIKHVKTDTQKMLASRELALNNQINLLQDKLRAAEESSKQLQDQHRTERHRLEAKCADRDDKVTHLQETLTTVQTELTQTHAQLEATRGELATTTDKLSKAQASVTNLQHRCDELEADKHLAHRVSRLAADDVSSELERAVQERHKLQSLLNDTKHEFEKAMDEQRLEYEATIRQQAAELEALQARGTFKKISPRKRSSKAS
eukprot:m.102088 g.102088  ORF g.102088 m.102088 type:complete len:363 (+) comp10423_c0_seq2:1962-3050(+)